MHVNSGTTRWLAKMVSAVTTRSYPSSVPPAAARGEHQSSSCTRTRPATALRGSETLRTKSPGGWDDDDARWATSVAVTSQPSAASASEVRPTPAPSSSARFCLPSPTAPSLVGGEDVGEAGGNRW